MMLQSLHRCVCLMLLILQPSYYAQGSKTTIAFASSSPPSSSPPCTISPPPPISVPVWSLACPLTTNTDNTSTSKPKNTNINDETRTSMNIVTFATPVSVLPPKLWVVSLYLDTMTRDAFLSSKVGVLQLLSKDQSALVPLLGKQSGYRVTTDVVGKREACKRVNMEWTECCDFGLVEEEEGEVNVTETMTQSSSSSLPIDVLPKCASYMKLKVVNTMRAGDHDVALCQVIQTGTWDEGLQRVIPLSCSKKAPGATDQRSVLYTGQLRDEGII